MKAPFPWPGGKSRAAHYIWAALGDCLNYVEPFAGSLAVLLSRPTAPKIETVNDADCYLANFWRALQAAPDEVARFADWPVNEADLHARHLWLVKAADFRERMRTDPDYFDAKVAGWWVWGLCQWIGTGWCDMARETPSEQLPHLGDAGMSVHRKLPHLGDAGRGVHRKLPHLGDAGRGVHRKLPHLGDAGRGAPSQQLPFLGGGPSQTGTGIHGATMHATMHALAARLRRVRVACGDWSRVMGDSVTWRHGVTGIVFDPPYDDGCAMYAAGGQGVAADVRAWCAENGNNPMLRIALCGYEGDPEPQGWTKVEWKAAGGYGNQSKTGNTNARRERIWFSPACLGAGEQLGLFSGGVK